MSPVCRFQTSHGERILVMNPSPESNPSKASANTDPRKAPSHPEDVPVLKQLNSIWEHRH